MYRFRDVLRRSSRNENKDVWYSEADAQPLFRLIQRYHEENPDISNSEIYNNIIELFIKANSEIVKLPSLKSDTFRYNICKELNRSPSKRREAYDKIHREEKGGRTAKIDKTTVYSSNKLVSTRTLTLQGLLGLRAQQNQFPEEMQTNYRRFFEATKKFQNSYKRTLNIEERKQLEELRKLFEGDEYTQFSLFLKDCEPALEKELKEDYIATIMFLGDRLKEFGMLEKYNEIHGKLYRALGVSELEYPLSGEYDDTISVEGLFTKEFLSKLDIEKLSMLNVFWMNRYTKELDALNKSLCIINELDLWYQVRTAKPKADNGMISIDVDKEKLKYVYRKIHFLQETSLLMLDELDLESESDLDEEVEGITTRRIVRRVDPSKVLLDMETDMGADYAEYFSNLLPEESHHFYEEFDTYRVMENAIHNTYRFKDFNMIAILSNLYQNNSSKNWGIILEDGKDIENQDMILIGIDVAGLNMPVRLHIEKEVVLEFLKANQETTIISLYEGDRDFYSRNLGKTISTPILMPLCKRQKEGVTSLLETMNQTHSSRNFIEHIAFLADPTKYPDHLKEEYVSRKKGKSKIQKRKPNKKYVDLVTGKMYKEIQSGMMQEIEIHDKQDYSER